MRQPTYQISITKLGCFVTAHVWSEFISPSLVLLQNSKKTDAEICYSPVLSLVLNHNLLVLSRDSCLLSILVSCTTQFQPGIFRVIRCVCNTRKYSNDNRGRS